MLSNNWSALINVILGAAATLEASGVTNVLSSPGNGKAMAVAAAGITFLNALAHITSPATPGALSADSPSAPK